MTSTHHLSPLLFVSLEYARHVDSNVPFIGLGIDLPNESCHQCAQHLRERFNDPRIRYLFGSPSYDDAIQNNCWLHITLPSQKPQLRRTGGINDPTAPTTPFNDATKTSATVSHGIHSGGGGGGEVGGSQGTTNANKKQTTLTTTATTTPFPLRQWELLSEPTPNMGENDTSLSLHLFAARKC